MKKIWSLLLILALGVSLLPGTGISAMAYASTIDAIALTDANNAETDSDLATVEEIQSYYDSLAQTASSTKAIIVVPGICGSALKRNPPNQLCWIWIPNLNLLKCDETGNSIESIEATAEGNLWPGITYGVLGIYGTLCDELDTAFGSEYDVVFFPYDWRLSSTNSAELLDEFIQDSGYSSVILVAHSMGGIVASKYIDITEDEDRTITDKLVTIGTPFLGAPKAVYVMETGDMFGLLENTIQDIAQNFPAVYELLPTSMGFTNYVSQGGTLISGYNNTTNFLKTQAWGKKSSGTAKPMFTSAHTFHTTLYSGTTHIANSGTVPTLKIYGNGVETINTVAYDASGNYIENGIGTTNVGDGTVLTASARCNTFTNVDYVLNVDHLDLVKSDDVIEKVINYISGNTLSVNNTSSSAQYFEVNDRGWIEGLESSTLIKVTVDRNAEVEIKTGEGDVVQQVRDQLYIADEDMKRVGTVFIMGENKQYSLYNGEYEISINSENLTVENNLTVDYFDSGYYKQAYVFENVGAYTSTLLNVESFESKEVLYRGYELGNQTLSSNSSEVIIEPSKILYETDLLDVQLGDIK